MSADFLSLAQAAVQAGGAVIAANYGKDKSKTYKSDRSPVTATDLAAEAAIIKVLHDAYPAHAYYSEEVGHSKVQSDYTWVIDPLDGTTNFSREIAFCASSVALVHNDTILAGAVYAPMLKQMFSAAQNGGAFLNGKRIRVTQVNELNQLVVGFGSRTSDRERAMPALARVTDEVRTYRVLGSFALNLCYVAAGKLDATVGTSVALYDGVAGALIAREAGAQVTDFQSRNWSPGVGQAADLVASSPAIHQKIIDLLAQV